MEKKTKIKWEIGLLALLTIVGYLPLLAGVIGFLFELGELGYFILFVGLFAIPLTYLCFSWKCKWLHENIYVKIIIIYLVVLSVVLILNSFLYVMCLKPW
ncbi:MAG: hypothetical protein ACYTER_07000 [Planctomycetota bacterium]|jgi:hypothetical protein